MKHDLDSGLLMRLQFLVRVVRKKCQYIASTDQRLFHTLFNIEGVKRLETNLELSERVEDFVGRFGRLQDTIADKLLSALWVALGGKPGMVIDNLDKAERLGLLTSANEWMLVCQ